MDAGSIMALGGAGATAQVGIRLFGMVASALARSQQAETERKDQDHANWADTMATAANHVESLGGPWVYRMFAITCVFIVVSPLMLPMFMDVTIHFFVPKDQGFFAWFSFDKAKLTEYLIPEMGKEVEDTTRHVALFPFMYSFASNVAWFYLSGRPMKHKF